MWLQAQDLRNGDEHPACTPVRVTLENQAGETETEGSSSQGVGLNG